MRKVAWFEQVSVLGGFWGHWLRIWNRNSEIQNDGTNIAEQNEKKLHVSDRTRYSGVIGSAYYEAELKIKEFKMADLNEKLFDSDRTLAARVKKNESWRVLLQSHAYNPIRDSRRDSFFYAGSRATAAFGRNDFKTTTMVVLCKNVETKRPNFFVARSCHLQATANNLEFEIKNWNF